MGSERKDATDPLAAVGGRLQRGEHGIIWAMLSGECRGWSLVLS